MPVRSCIRDSFLHEVGVEQSFQVKLLVLFYSYLSVPLGQSFLSLHGLAWAGSCPVWTQAWGSATWRREEMLAKFMDGAGPHHGYVSIPCGIPKEDAGGQGHRPLALLRGMV